MSSAAWNVCSRCIASPFLIAALAGVDGLAAGRATAAERPVLEVPNAQASTEAEMKPYAEIITHTDATIEMVPIPGGSFTMGSPRDEEGRDDGEGPRVNVEIDPFWMAKYETTWDAYRVWVQDMDELRRELKHLHRDALNTLAWEYQKTQPTPPWEDAPFDMGQDGYPAVCMTQFSGKIFCKWLSAKTGRYYRLPTEAEWEYACRAGTTTAYHFGDDPDELEDYGWFYDNSDEKYQAVGRKKPNPWGLYDMHGNVAEWTLDQFVPGYGVEDPAKTLVNPLVNPTKLYPRVVRGGAWDSDPELLRSAARIRSTEDWKKQDPQIPKSIWHHTDATMVGFRIIRPLVEPSEEEQKEKWDKSTPFEDRKKER